MQKVWKQMKKLVASLPPPRPRKSPVKLLFLTLCFHVLIWYPAFVALLMVLVFFGQTKPYQIEGSSFKMCEKYYTLSKWGDHHNI